MDGLIRTFAGQQVQNCWSELSADVVELIFSKLSEECVVRAASVCKRWYSVTQLSTFSDFYRKTSTINSCLNSPVFTVNGSKLFSLAEDIGRREDSFRFQPIQKCFSMPTFPCPDDGQIPTVKAAGGAHHAFTGLKQTTMRYKLCLFEKSWRTTPKMSYFVQDPVVGVVEDASSGGNNHKIVVAGGVAFQLADDNDLVVTVYDCRTDSWEHCDPLPSQFRGCSSSLFMAAVVHKGQFWVYDMYSGYASGLDMESKRWGKIMALRPSAEVNQLFLVSRSGELCLVGVEDAFERDLRFKVWKVVEDGFNEKMRVGELLHSSVIPNARAPPTPAMFTRWASAMREFSLSVVGVLLLFLVQFIILCYSVTSRAICFLQGLVKSTTTQFRKQHSFFRLRTE